MPSVAGQKVPLDRLTLPQSHPGRDFDTLALEQLTASAKEHGILQPILVRPVGEKYELVTGAIRYRAVRAKKAPGEPVELQALMADISKRVTKFRAWEESDKRGRLAEVRFR